MLLLVTRMPSTGAAVNFAEVDPNLANRADAWFYKEEHRHCMSVEYVVAQTTCCCAMVTDRGVLGGCHECRE